jgi:hypothetical protein
VNYSDPFGLCPRPDDLACELFEAGMTLLGGTLGFVAGGGLGLLEIAATGGLATPAAVATAATGTALGAAAGKAAGQALSNLFFAENSSESAEGSSAPRYKTPASGRSGAEAARDVPSWARGNRPMVGENGKQFAKRLLDEKYGNGQWEGTGPGSEFSKLKKWGDRGFVDPR